MNEVLSILFMLETVALRVIDSDSMFTCKRPQVHIAGNLVSSSVLRTYGDTVVDFEGGAFESDEQFLRGVLAANDRDSSGRAVDLRLGP